MSFTCIVTKNKKKDIYHFFFNLLQTYAIMNFLLSILQPNNWPLYSNYWTINDGCHAKEEAAILTLTEGIKILETRFTFAHQCSTNHQLHLQLGLKFCNHRFGFVCSKGF